MLFDEKSRQLSVEAVKGLKKHTIRITKINVDEDIIQGIIERKAAIFPLELEETLPIKILFQKMAEKVEGDIVLSIPLVAKKNLVGLVNLGRRESEAPFKQADLQFLYTLAGPAAMAIHNANLYRKKIEEEKLRVIEHKQAEEALQKAHGELEVKVEERTSELKKKTGELEQANIQLKELDRLKSMFIASMSHELRTPLNSIIGFTGLILQGISGEVTEDQRKELTMVKSSANHLLALINDVIDVSKIEAGQIDLIINEFDLVDLMREVKGLFTVAIDKKGLKLLLKMPERLAVKSDARRVKQVIMNLVSNALKFTDKGKIEIKITKKDKIAEVSVADTGTGIKKENMDKLFKQFSRIYIKGRPIVEGTGLGLYLSQKIAGLLGGQIKAESELDKGSVFTFTLSLEFSEVT